MSAMGIIGCSVLANELAYLVRRDPEAKEVIVIDTAEGREAAAKLRKVRACEQIELVEWDQARLGADEDDRLIIWMNPSDLHDGQEKMRNALTAQVVRLSGSVDSILMLYGQCRCQTLDVPALQSEVGVPIIFLTDRSNAVVDDCIAATLGGCQNYLALMKAHKGTLFVTPGYVEEHARKQRELDLVQVLEHVEQTKSILDYVGYRAVLKLDSQLDGCEEYNALVTMFSRTFDLEVHTKLCNLAVFEDTYDWAKSAMRAQAREGQPSGAYCVVWG
jgi:hypothetical protein